jgi:hypothetical protein
LIKEILDSWYKKTVGAARDYVWGALTKGTRGGSILELVYILALVGLMAGFVSAVFTPVANQSYIVYPSSTSQSIPELLVDSMVIFVGGAGVYLIFLSGRQTTRARTVNLYLALAVLLVTVSVLTGIEVSILKGFG